MHSTLSTSIAILFMLFSYSGHATTYTSTADSAWSPSNPSNNLISSDTFIVSHEVALIGLQLNSGGVITINNGGIVHLSSGFQSESGSKVTVLYGGELSIQTGTWTNKSESINIFGKLTTKNSTISNNPGGEFHMLFRADWESDQFTFANYGDLLINAYVTWESGTVSFLQGTTIINSEIQLQNMNFSNLAALNGIGRITNVSSSSFTSSGTINGCSGNTCVTDYTIGATTYLAGPLLQGDSLYVSDGTNLPSGTCNQTLLITDDYNFQSDYTIGKLMVPPGVRIIVNASQTLSICDFIYNEDTVAIANGGSLIITDSSASIFGSGVGIVGRNTHTSSTAYNAIGSPMQSSNILTTFSSSNPCDFFCFEGNTQSWKYDYENNLQTTCNGNNVTFTSSYLIAGGDNVMDPGRGYFSPGLSSGTVSFTGTFNCGNISVPVSATTLGNNPFWNDDDWNLLSNPYPSAINLDSLYYANQSVLNGNFYLWVDDNSQGSSYNQSSDYAVYNEFGSVAANGSNTPTNILASCQGFWVLAKNSGTVQFTNSMRTTGNNSSIYKAPQDKTVFRLNLENESGHFNQTCFGFTSTSTNGYDETMDAPKGQAYTGVSIGSWLDSTIMTIQAIQSPTYSSPARLPLFVSTTTSAIHTFELDSQSVYANDIEVYLFDSLLQFQYNLTANPVPLFLDSGLYANRFFIMINELPAISNIERVAERESNVIILTTPHGFELQLKNDQFFNYQLTDMSGKIIAKKDSPVSSSVQIDIPNQTPGTYIITGNTSAGTKFTEKVIYAP